MNNVHPLIIIPHIPVMALVNLQAFWSYNQHISPFWSHVHIWDLQLTQPFVVVLNKVATSETLIFTFTNSLPAEPEWVPEWVPAWAWVSTWVSTWVSLSEYLSEYLGEHLSEHLSEYLGEYLRVPEWISGWTLEWAPEWAPELAPEWEPEWNFQLVDTLFTQCFYTDTMGDI